jgi:hypothetical protein
MIKKYQSKRDRERGRLPLSPVKSWSFVVMVYLETERVREREKSGCENEREKGIWRQNEEGEEEFGGKK